MAAALGVAWPRSQQEPRYFRLIPLSAAEVGAWAGCGSADSLGTLVSEVEGGVGAAERC